jgi:serine/threonine protein phosphatase 1
MGKVYVCSDVHAHTDVLKEALAVLQEDDQLYMIGDAVDKGPDGLEPLKILMDDPRCEMLIGNHDLMFLQQCMCMMHRGEIPFILNEDIYQRWQILNFGYVTWNAFLKESDEEQERIIHYLQERPLLKLLEVNGRKFCLVHAAIPEDFDVDDLHDLYLDTVQDKRIPFLYDWRSDFVWGRYVTELDDYTVIVGHTAAQYFHEEYIRSKNDDWYDIDCGLAYNEKTSKLALLCLDTMEVRYFYPKRLASFTDRR